MASQEIPETYDPVVQLLEDAAGGADSLGVSVGLKQNDGASLRATLEALVGKPEGPGGVPPAVPGLKALWNNAKADKTAKTAIFVSKKSEGRTLAMACVNSLKPRLGNQWNNKWQTAGFTNASLEIPDNPLTLLQQLRAYYEAHPTHEIDDAVEDVHLTAAACHAMAQGISTASAASNASNTAAGTAKKNLRTGIRTARRKLTGLREELSQILEDDDERWYTFGFSRPSDPETLEVPENVTAVAGPPGSGEAAVDWDDARRARSYRATVKVAATSVEVATQLVEDSDADFDDLPAGIPLSIAVTALNDAGESVASDAVTITLPGELAPPAPPQNATFVQGPNPGDALEANAEADPTVTLWRVYARPTGSGDTPVLVASSATLPMSFTHAPGEFEFTMTAANAGGESGPSSPPVPVTIV
jgi:hypothetical protein